MESEARETLQNFGENEPEVETSQKTKNYSMKLIIGIISIVLIIVIITIILIISFEEEEDNLNCPDGCKDCIETELGIKCISCFSGYIFIKDECIDYNSFNYSIKAIYKTDYINETIPLIHYMFVPHIKMMVIDDRAIIPNSENQFPTIGNHTIYYLFDNELDYLGEMFYGADQLISITFTPIFDTSNINNLNFMFYGCINLAFINISSFNTENVENLSGMFELCKSLKSIDLKNFNTQNVTSMNMMFYGCSSLTSIDISHFNTQYLTGMNNMFDGCNNLTSLNLSNFNTKYVTGMTRLFNRCYSLKSIDLSNFNIEKVRFMEGMFEDCHSLTSLNISNFNTENVTKIDYMFYRCPKLEFLDISGFVYDKNVSLFYDLPEFGTLIVNKDFIDKINNQIPPEWEIKIK